MSNLYINTTQNVKLFFTTASIGQRIFAYGIDLLIKAAYLIVIIIIYSKTEDSFDNMSEGLQIALGALVLFPIVFYTLTLEFLLEGRTPGKMLFKTKVVKIDGYQAGFFDYFIRWIFAVIDIHMSFIPGLIAMISTRHTQRLGDLAAGTAVISEKSKVNISHTILMNVSDEYLPYFSANQVLLFSDNDIRIIKENAEKAIKEVNLAVLQKICSKIESILNITNPYNSERKLIEQLLKDYNYHTGKN